MFKGSVFLSVVIAFFLQSSYVSAQVYLSEYAAQGVENFENDRPGICLNYAHDIQQMHYLRDESPNFSPREGLDESVYQANLKNLRGIEKSYEFLCTMDYVTFIDLEVEKVCQNPENLANPFCETIREFQEIERAEGVRFFVDNFSEIEGNKVVFGWILNEIQHVTGGVTGNALSRRGNHYLGLSLELVEISEKDLLLADFPNEDYIFIETWTDENEEARILPLFTVFGMSIGTADDYHYVGLEFFEEENSPLNPKASWPEIYINWNDAYYFETPLTKNVINDLLSTKKVTFYGRYSNNSEFIFFMDVDNSKFEKVLNELLQVLSTLGPEGRG